MIKMIVCCDLDGAIGYKNELLFNIKEDMKFFKETTTGHKVVMGYNTWMSLPKKPLPNRDNYILTSRTDIEENDNTHVIRSIDDIIELGKNDDVFIIGGGKLYCDMIYKDLIDEAYVTMVGDLAPHADAYVHLFELSKNLHHRELIKVIDHVLPIHIYKFYRINKDIE